VAVWVILAPSNLDFTLREQNLAESMSVAPFIVVLLSENAQKKDVIAYERK
jgi:hypothetical protein